MVNEVEVEWECVEAGEWIVVDQLELEGQVVLGVSVEVGEVTVVDSEDAEEWIGEDSAVLDVEGPPWTAWVAEVGEEWGHQEERWK